MVDLDEIPESTVPLVMSVREICEIFGKEENFKKNKKNIEEHMKTHSIHDMHRCEICGKEENSKKEIEDHMKKAQVRNLWKRIEYRRPN